MSAITLVIQENPQIWIPVTVKTAINGGFSSVKIELLVALETSEKVERILKDAVEKNKNVDQSLFESTVKDWRGLGSDADTELKFNKTNVKKFIAQSWLLGPCSLAIMNAHNGIIEELEKN